MWQRGTEPPAAAAAAAAAGAEEAHCTLDSVSPAGERIAGVAAAAGADAAGARQRSRPQRA
jgi:hypothetical protein